jgi:hypothetical protein
MADPVVADVSGLQLSNSTFSASPPGSLLRAEECVMPQKGVIEPRRGQAWTAATPSATVPFQVTEFSDTLIASCSASKAGSSYVLAKAGTNPLTSYSGTYNPVDSQTLGAAAGRMKFGFAGSYMYFCAETGPKALETVASTVRTAGLLRMPDCLAAMASKSAASGGANWLAYGSAVAYRTVLRKPTSDGTSLLSPPSGRSVVVNQIVAPIGAMVRNANVVTVTLPGVVNPGLITGDTFTIDPGEANFPAALETVATDALNVITYADVAANATNTVAQDLDTGARSTSLTIYLSDDATVATPIRIYRSRATSSSVEPSDEMFLVDEVYPTAGQITAGSITYSDITPESVINDPLYTNPLTGEGAAQANYQPPIYRDISGWAERTWYANTTGLQTFNIQMLGVGSPSGVQDGDEIYLRINATPVVSLEFKNAPGASDEVQIVSNGTQSFNIQQTSQDFVLTFNDRAAAAGVDVRAYYNSGQDEAPGKILIQATTYEQEAFDILVERAASWSPAFNDGDSEDSVAERLPNGLSYSKLGQPESVPPLNYMQVGSKNYAIARILGLRNALLVFKEGDGIYSVTGSFPFSVVQISTANIVAPDCCTLFADSAWVYTDQGILRVSDSGGATVVSRPIETELNELRALYPSETRDWSFAVSYESERRVMFFVPFAVSAVTGRPELKAWSYNNATQAWTGPLYLAGETFSGITSPSEGKLKLGTFSATWNGLITTERKTMTVLDMADRDFSATISAVDVGGDPLVVTVSVVTDIEAGDGISQSGWSTKIRSVDGNNLTLYEEVPFTAAVCTIYKHYDVTLQFQPTGSPSSRKTLTRLTWLAKPEHFESFSGNTLLLTDAIQADLEIATPSVGFGSNPFGTGPFGDPTPLAIDVNPVNPKWANAAQFFVGFETSEVWVKLKLQGYAATLETASAPAGRGR